MSAIEEKMLSATKSLDFEAAAKLRDEMFALKGGVKEVKKPTQNHRRRRKKM